MKLASRTSFVFKKRNVLLVAIGLSLPLAITGAIAWAGNRVTTPVLVDVTNRYAWGVLGDARNSQDSFQDIGCNSIASATVSGITCSARDSSGTYVSCNSTDVRLLDESRALSGDVNIAFGWDASGNCTYLQIATYSDYFPAQP